MNRKLTGMADYSKFPSKLWWLMRGMDLLHTGAIEDSKKNVFLVVYWMISKKIIFESWQFEVWTLSVRYHQKHIREGFLRKTKVWLTITSFNVKLLDIPPEAPINYSTFKAIRKFSLFYLSETYVPSATFSFWRTAIRTLSRTVWVKFIPWIWSSSWILGWSSSRIFKVISLYLKFWWGEESVI